MELLGGGRGRLDACCCWKLELMRAVAASVGTVLHPRCTILALSGPIVVGSNCIVEENAVIVNR